MERIGIRSTGEIMAKSFNGRINLFKGLHEAQNVFLFAPPNFRNAANIIPIRATTAQTTKAN